MVNQQQEPLDTASASLLTSASISTMWAIDNFTDLSVFFQLARSIGFQEIELNHQVGAAMLAHIDLDHYQFSSIHEPCPSEFSARQLADRDWVISSTNNECRTWAVSAIKRSIDLAAELSAQVVVIHCGNVIVDTEYEAKLRNLYKSGQAQTKEYQAIKSQFVEARKVLAPPRLESVKKSLLELLEYAEKKNVSLGLENRYHYMDIPIIDEMQGLLELAEPGRLGFIYDSGHAEALARLGFFPHRDWLSSYSDRIFGAHLHDITGLSDHLAPGLGELDFHSISQYLPGASFRTMEVKPGNTLAQIRDGLALLVNTGCVKNL